MAELPGVERETLDVDVVIVGAGPAGLAAAYQLARLIKANNESPAAAKKLENISIAVLEKGKEIGSHAISGAVMAIRNPGGHRVGVIEQPDRALQHLGLLSYLADRLDETKKLR